MVASETARGTPYYRTAPVADGAEALVEALVTYGVDCIFINSGTDTFPIQEAIARRMEQGRPVPRVVLCLDEMMGLSAAQGYFQVTGRTQAVLVHVDQGTAQLGGALHNAQRARAGVLLCAGRAPFTFLNEMPGGRDLNIHWLQEQRDQAGVVRTFTKWEYELRHAGSAGFIVHRALQVASAEPAGPVYLILPRESLMQPLQEVRLPDPARHSLPITPPGDPEALRAIALLLVRAQSPLIVAGNRGRRPALVPALVTLAEAVGARVVTGQGALAFPTDHPLWAGMGVEEHLPGADAVLVVDADVPWIPARAQPHPRATVAMIDIEPIKETMPLWSFPADILVHADSAKALPLLAEEARRLVGPQEARRIEARAATIAVEATERRGRVERRALSLGAERPIAPEWLAHCIAQVLPPEALVLDESVTNRPAVVAGLPRTVPGSLLTSGGTSLGWALGAAVGAKLAAPEWEVVALVGDGAFIYGAPTSALWAADKYQAPFLTVIFNNREHFAPKRALQAAYPDSASQRMGTWVGMEIDPSPEYALVAQACRAYGERVDGPGDLVPALRRGLDQVRKGHAAVIDVRLRMP